MKYERLTALLNDQYGTTAGFYRTDEDLVDVSAELGAEKPYIPTAKKEAVYDHDASRVRSRSRSPPAAASSQTLLQIDDNSEDKCKI